jgi:hypothetical protein
MHIPPAWTDFKTHSTRWRSLSNQYSASGRGCALINATTDGAARAYDPRYGMADLFEPGRRGFLAVKFLF